MNWGILGAGQIARGFAESISVVKDSTLYAVASRSLEKANAFKESFHAIKAYDSYEALVEDEAVDVIYIATIHPLHKEHILLCLNHHKHVLCEKPLTMNAQDAQEVYEVAKKNHLFLMEAMWTKFLPTIQAVETWIIEGKIGEVKLIQAEFGFQNSYNEESRLFNKSMGGGSLLDIGIYPLTLATLFLGCDDIKISAFAQLGKSEVDEQTLIILQNERGQQAQLVSTFQVELQNKAIIHGTKGTIVIPKFWQAEQAFLYKGNRLLIEYASPFLQNGYEYEQMEVNRLIQLQHNQSTIHSMEDTIHLLEIMDEVRKQIHLTYNEE